MPTPAPGTYHRVMDQRPAPLRLGPVRLVDALIALGLLALGVIWVAPGDAMGLQGYIPRGVPGYVLLAFQTLPLAWRHTAPRTVVLIVLASWVIDRDLGYEAEAATLGLVVAIHGVAAYASRRQAILWGIGTAAVAIVWTGVGTIYQSEVGLRTVITMALWVTIPFAIGRGDAFARERITELEVRSQTAEIAQQEAAEAAVRTERARIARELHDVVAHEITVMTLQAEGARRAVGDKDPRVSQALQTIGDSGRKGLAEMHRMIGVLRDTSEGDRPGSEPSVGTAYAPARVDFLSPMPSLAALPALVKQVGDAGMPVELRVRGNSHVPAGVELSAYRIVQEALTNALKHAGPGAHASVDIDRARTAVTITVEDDGRGVISDATEGGSGHGLAGMRERVATLGGSIELGPRPGGGYRVRAILPSQDDVVNTPSRERKDSIAAIISLVDTSERKHA
jgi:signal transduction histidine kinase